MASKASRWADAAEDAVLEAQRKKDKEDKKRLKAEKARKLEAERQARLAAAPAAASHEPKGDDDDGTRPPPKRRKLSPEHEGRGSEPRLLRFSGGTWGPCRSVEHYEKLNDIEEGAYGWVARARELASGRVVALKRLKIEPKDRGGLPVTGLREIQILKDCEHRNIVGLREIVVGGDTRKIDK